MFGGLREDADPPNSQIFKRDFKVSGRRLETMR
jgi:hypothetical protein